MKRTVEKVLGPVFHEDSVRLEESALEGMIKLDDLLKQIHAGLGGTEVSHDFTVVESFSSPEGKFGD